jgi:hypothetical protein
MIVRDSLWVWSGACLVFAAALSACGSAGSGDRDAFTVRDSAGVRIAESVAPTWRAGEAWRLSDEPVLEVGMVDGPAEYVLGNVAGVLGTADGGVLVADGQAKNLRWYDAAGRHVRTVGREGAGPGEFRHVSRLVPYRADTVVVVDWMNRRLTFLTGDGTVIRDESTRTGDETGTDDPIAYAPDGSAILRARPARADVPRGLVRDTFALRRRSIGSGAYAELGSFPGTEAVYMDAGGGGFSVIARAFGTCACVAPLADGFVAGTGEAPEVVRYDAHGRPERRIRWSGTRRPVTPSDVSAYRARELASTHDRTWMEQLLGEMDYPQEMPVYADVVADAEENLWVRRYDPDPETMTEWWVFTPEGRLLGTVETPAGLRVREIGADHVLGIWLDDLRVQYVRRYALLKPAG